MHGVSRGGAGLARPVLTRRRLLGLAAGGAVAVAVGGRGLHGGPPASGPVLATSPEVAATEAGRAVTGRVVRQTLSAAPMVLDVGGRPVQTWAYDGGPGADPIRVTRGDVLQLDLRNELPEPTAIHWHGLALRNDMDGVPGLTQDPVAPGTSFRYRFVVPHSGTYFFHAHVETQRERGLYRTLVVDDPAEPGSYDHDVVLALDDWIDGFGAPPEQLLSELRAGGGTPATAPVVDTSSPWGPMLGDVRYPLHLVNGRTPADPFVVRARPGERVRLRLINAGGDTTYRLAVGGHRMLVTHTDGWPVQPTEVDALLLGMGERYDVLVTADDGTFPVLAEAEGRGQSTMAVLTTGSSLLPSQPARPAELDRHLLAYSQLQPLESARLPRRTPDRTHRLLLAGDPSTYVWSINGGMGHHGTPLPMKTGERVRLVLANATAMPHPMHVHGHTFALDQRIGGSRKDTVVVLPGEELAIDLEADNPGQWLTHCHNAYHMAGGMATTLSYER